MHAGDQPLFAGGLVQQTFPGLSGLFRIDVEGDRDFWPGGLNGREMDNIPPDEQRGIARLETIPGMAGRMAGQRARVDPGDRLLTINFANLRRADCQYAVDEQHVAPAAIAGVVQCGCRQPVSAFPRRQEHRGVGIRRGAGCRQQSADVIRVRVGEEDGVNLLRAYAEQRQIGDKRTADAIDSPGAGIHQYGVPASADKIGADRNDLR